MNTQDLFKYELDFNNLILYLWGLFTYEFIVRSPVSPTLENSVLSFKLQDVGININIWTDT